MKAEKKKNNMVHIALLAFLAVVFLVLIFFSSGGGVSEEYTFTDEQITITKIPSTYNSGFKIGEVQVENNWILPAKVKLKNLVVCYLLDTQGDRPYRVNYVGADTSYNIYYEGSYQALEISGGESKTLEIEVLSDYYPLRPTIVDLDLNGKINTFYLFEVDEGTDVYSVCSELEEEDALKQFEVLINVSESDLNESKFYY